MGSMDTQKFFVEHKNQFIICLVLLALLIGSFYIDHEVTGVAIKIYNPTIALIFEIITFFGEMLPFITLALIISLICYNLKKGFVGLWLAIGTNALIVYGIKHFAARLRPYEFLDTGSLITTQYSSFPSGHAAAFFCIAPIMSDKFPKIRWIFWTAAILVAVSRVYLQVHFLSDVIAGAIIGYSVGVLWLFLEKKFKLDRPL